MLSMIPPPFLALDGPGWPVPSCYSIRGPDEPRSPTCDAFAAPREAVGIVVTSGPVIDAFGAVHCVEDDGKEHARRLRAGRQ